MRLAWMWCRLRHTKYGRTVTIQLDKGGQKRLSWKGRSEKVKVDLKELHLMIALPLLPTSVPVPPAFLQLYQLSADIRCWAKMETYSYLGFQLVHLLKPSFIQLCCLERNT